MTDSDSRATGEDPAASKEPPTAPKKGVKRRIVLSIVAGVIITVAIFALIVPEAASYEKAFEELLALPGIWIVAMVLASVFNITVYPLTVRAAIPGFAYWRCFVERQAGFTISNTVPGGGAVALGTQYEVLAHYRVKPTVAASAVSADAVFTYLISLALPSVALALLLMRGEQANSLMTVSAILGFIAVLVSVALLILILRTEKGAVKTGELAEKILAPFYRRFRRPTPQVVPVLVRFRNDASQLVKDKWKSLFLTNLLAQTAPALVLFFAVVGLEAFPGQVDIVEILAAYSIAMLLVMVPLTPGGLGPVDIALVGLLTSFGMSGPSAVAADLIWRLLWFIPQILSGGIALLVYVIARNRQRRHGVEPQAG